MSKQDGIDYINIGSLAETPLGRFLGYYDTTPKIAPNEGRFLMYAGYYYYCITEGDNTRFLRAKSPRELEAKSKFAWVNVPGMQTALEGALSFNIYNSPLATSLLARSDLPIDWIEPDRELKNNERRWLRAVQSTVARIRSNIRP